MQKVDLSDECAEAVAKYKLRNGLPEEWSIGDVIFLCVLKAKMYDLFKK
jgi:NTP pyrophosphatase (non-canonical NTP hydrolase)